MKTGTYIYTKRVTSGRLIDLEVNCHLNHITAEEAEKILGIGKTGTDIHGGAEWIVTSGYWIATKPAGS